MRAAHSCSRKLFFLITLSGLVLGGMVTPVFSQTDTFSAGSGNWSQATNWSLGALPMSNNDCAFLSNGVIIDDAAGVCQNVALASGDSLTIATPSTPTSYLYVYGTSLTNPGTITLTQSSGLHIAGNAGNVVTLSGGGSVVLSGPNTGIVWATTGETRLVNSDNTIQGVGVIGQGTIDLTNEKTIMSNGGLLDIQPAKGGLTNTGLMEASSGSTLQFDAGFQTIPFNNAGGTVEALNGSTVNINSGTWSGGTFTTAGTGVMNVVVPAMNGVTNTGTMTIPSSGDPTFEGVTANSGTIQLQGIMFFSGNATLTGSGALLMTGSGSRIESLNSTDTLTNQQLIHGSGAIYALNVDNQATIQADNTSTPLSLTDQFAGGTPTINTGTLQASGGGTLQIENTVHNIGGMITAQTGSTVLLANGVVDGGMFSTTGTGTIQSQNGTLDGRVNIPTNSGAFIVPTPYSLSLEGTIANNGIITLKPNSCLDLLQPTTLTGSGQLVMGATSCVTGSGESFTNQSVIRGAGNIGDSNPMPIVNNGTIMANSSTSSFTITPDATGFTNNGTLSVNAGSTLNIKGAFNNFANKTLTGGIYSLSGTLEFPNASIATNNGSLTLNGARGQILDSVTLTNALTALALNSSKGIFSLQHGASLATTAALINDGKTTIGAGSSLSVSSSYTQSAGSTTVDGKLTAPAGAMVTAGSLMGQGTISAPVTVSGGSITVGDSTAKPGLLTVTGTYTQNTATADLNVAIGGNTAGTQYSQLAVSNGIALDGVLTIKLVNHFVPTVGTSFTILKGTAVSGTFTTLKGASINSSEHFQVNYQSNEVALEVVAGP